MHHLHCFVVYDHLPLFQRLRIHFITPQCKYLVKKDSYQHWQHLPCTHSSLAVFSSNALLLPFTCVHQPLLSKALRVFYITHLNVVQRLFFSSLMMHLQFVEGKEIPSKQMCTFQPSTGSFRIV